MAKIARFNGAQMAFATTSIGTDRTIFADTTSSDDLTANITSNFLLGWADSTTVDNDKPPVQWFNAVHYVATQLSAYLHQAGVAEYDALQPYYIHSYCNYNGTLYVSLTDDNIGNQPDVSATEWRSIFFDAALLGVPTAPTAAPLTDTTQIATTAFVTGDPGRNQSGFIVAFGGTVVPSGYLGCDGTAVSRTTYAPLFSAIGTTWGSGDGSTTFNLPNLQRRALVGSGGTGSSTLANTVGATGGEETHTLTIAEMPSHDHPGSGCQGSTNNTSGATEYTEFQGNEGDVSQPSIFIAPQGGGDAFNIMQPAAVCLYVIKI